MSVRKRVWGFGASSAVALLGCNALLAFDDYSVPSSTGEAGPPADIDASDAVVPVNEGGVDSPHSDSAAT